MAPVANVTWRQVAAAALAVALGVGAAAAAVVDWPAVAAAAAGVAASATLVAVVLVRRRLWDMEVRQVRVRRMVTNLERELANRLDALEFGQRRLLAALEAERLAAAECRCRERAGDSHGQPGASPYDGARWAESGQR